MTFVPEYWDIGQWDTAHWDGQIGVTADTAAFTLTGYPVAFNIIDNVVMVAAPGAFALTGYPVNLVLTSKMSLVTGSFVWTGYPVQLTADYVLAADSAAFVWDGFPIGGIVGGAVTMTAEPATFVLTWQQALFAYGPAASIGPAGILQFGIPLDVNSNRW